MNKNKIKKLEVISEYKKKVNEGYQPSKALSPDNPPSGGSSTKQDSNK